MKLSIRKQARNAIFLGGMCALSYLAVYFTRNILSAVSPQVTEQGIFSREDLGALSSAYFIAYAFGQLINGAIGDKIKARYMISFGLILAAVTNFLVSTFSDVWEIAYITYALTGFFLSMIYGPMTKLVSENTEPIYATRCSLGYTFASFFGSPMAGACAVIMSWQAVFLTSSVFLATAGTLFFIICGIMERKGIISYGKFQRKKESRNGIKVLLKRGIVKFTLISVITGIVRTTVVFWLTTYINQHLGFDPESSAMIYTVATLVISASAFVAVFTYERLNRNMNLTILLAFIVSSLCFTGVYFVKDAALNILLLVLAILSSNCAASMLWSRYCPSLYDTGMVSSATGFLDFCSYMAASISSSLFANAVSDIGWNGLILVWFGLMVAGVIIALPYHKLRKNA